MLVQRSFQPPPLPTRRVVGGHVVRALAGHVEACQLQGGDHAVAVLHLPGLDALHQVVPDRLARVGLVRDPRPQLRRLDVGAVPRLLVPRPRRVIRAAPALVEVAGLDQGVVGLLPARRRDVEALAGLQVAPRGKHMHVHAAGGRAVLHRRPGVTIRLQPGPGALLELVEHPVDVPVARLVLRRPGDHARRVFVVELQRVGHRGHGVRIAAQDRHVVPDLALAVQLACQVVSRGLGRARAVREEHNQHRPRPARAAAPGRARWRPGGREPRRQ